MKRILMLDEAQEQTLLRMESRGLWLVFWLLSAAILVQTFFFRAGLRALAGELIVMLGLGFYIIIGCLKNGIWERSFAPSMKTNLLVSCAAGLVTGMFLGISNYLHRQDILHSIGRGLFCCALLFALIFAALTLCTALYRRRVKKLENAIDDEDSGGA